MPFSSIIYGCCRSKDRQRAKYELMCTERVLLTSDAAHNSIKVREDGEGQTGIFLAKEDLLAAAGESIKATLTKIAPRILPLAELARLQSTPLCSNSL